MAKTLTKIQGAVRSKVRNSELDLITAPENLAIFNRAYRDIASQFSWDELMGVDTSLTTIADTTPNLYTWPAVVYSDRISIEFQGTSSGAFIFDSPAAVFGTATFGGNATKYYPLTPPPSEYEWSMAEDWDQGYVPKYYKLRKDSSVLKLEVRPAPPTGSLKIRLSGLITPTELIASDGAVETIFRDDSLNDALACFVAAEIFNKQGLLDDYQIQQAAANKILQIKTGSELVPNEFLKVSDAE